MGICYPTEKLLLDGIDIACFQQLNVVFSELSELEYMPKNYRNYSNFRLIVIFTPCYRVFHQVLQGGPLFLLPWISVYPFNKLKLSFFRL